MASDSPTPGTETCPHEAWEVDSAGQRGRCVDCRTWLGPVAPSPVGTTEPPAETQQNDEPTREDRAVAAGLVRRARAANSDDEVDAARDAIAREIASERAAALAARPSADTETLPPVRAEIIRQVREAAWHDGYEACRRGDQPHNPYRAALADPR